MRGPKGYQDIAAKAVVLACGGFEANPEMRVRYYGPGWEMCGEAFDASDVKFSFERAKAEGSTNKAKKSVFDNISRIETPDPHTVIVLPYVLRLVVAAATGFDRSVSQAAQSLGAPGWTVFWRIELPLIVPGITTKEIDRIAADVMKQQGSVSATIGYQPGGYPPYPAHLCTSVNHVVCHGIPNDKPLKNGDIVNIDVTVIKDGWHGDTSRMFVVGEGSIAAKRLCAITYEAMWKGIERVRPGARLGDIGHAIQTFAEHAGYSVVREFCGHGVGARFHEEPQVLHYGRPGTLEELKPGMTFTIEPMINAGKRDIKEAGDGWTIVTRDRSLSAQWEHTVLVTPTGYEVLTLSAGSPPAPAFVGEAAAAAA